MSINKVVYGNDTLIDLTEDTVAPENLLSGATAHNAAGNPITGTARQGHDIYYSGSTLPMAGRAGLQFNDVEVEDDATNNKTIVMPQIRTCATQAEWDLIPDDVKNSPLIYWYLPFINGGDPLNSDKTPVGVVISASTPTAQTGEFPNKDYLVCDGNIVNISDYPQLAQYFQTYYGSINYFGGDGITTFKLPDYSRDYPQNGVLCIKAAVSGNIITFAEVDETGISSREDQVPNCARVADIEDELIYSKDTYTGAGKTWYFARYGKVVFMDSYDDCSSKEAGNTTLFTLPDKYKPYVMIRTGAANNSSANFFVSIQTDGVVRFYSAEAITRATNAAFSCCYIV